MENSDELPAPPARDESAAGSVKPAGKPWGIWETLGFSIVIACVFLGVSVLVFFIFLGIDMAANRKTDFDALAQDGLVFAVSSFAASMIGAVLVVGAAALRKGIRFKDYLNLNRPSCRTLLIWTVLLVVIFLPLEWVRTRVLGQPDVPESMLDMYWSCEFLPVLWLAIVIGAPVGEEFFFRGFLFEGIRHSRLGPVTAVVVCALIWAVIHFQYNAIDVSVIFIGGLFLGIAKLRTGSLWVPVFLHFIWNLLSMIQTAYVAGTAPAQ